MKEDRPMAQNTFHVALYVADLDAAIARYRKLLGQEPAKVRHDYAKFELVDPPVILSLNTGGEPGTVSHLGIRYPGTGDVATELVRDKQAQRGRNSNCWSSRARRAATPRRTSSGCATPMACHGRCTRSWPMPTPRRRRTSSSAGSWDSRPRPRGSRDGPAAAEAARRARGCRGAGTRRSGLLVTLSADARQLFTERRDVYARFIRAMRYPQGPRAFWRASPLLRPGLRLLEAGCGTGALTFGVWDAAARRGIDLGRFDAFDLTPAMLDRLGVSLQRRHVTAIRLAEANVLHLDALPADWRDYDLIVSASML